MRRGFLMAYTCLLLASGPAHADYGSARQSFDALSPEKQTAITLALIATGDFEGLAEHGYTHFLYDAIRQFERREIYG